MRKKRKYPGIEEAEKERSAWEKNSAKEEPDFIGGKPNYDKFKYWKPEDVLIHFNMD